MFALRSAPAESDSRSYDELLAQARALLAGERDPTANAANLASLLFHCLPGLNWTGFYWLRGPELVLGPFQGRPACVRIPLGRGVCGTAALDRRTLVVPDVEAFPGHIACDSASRSELVVPILGGRPGDLQSAARVLGVLDLDSPAAGRFGADDARGLEAIVAAFVEATDLG